MGGASEAEKAAFEQAFEGMEITEVRDAPIDGMVELDVNGRESVFMTEDGRYMVVGKLLEIKLETACNKIDRIEDNLQEFEELLWLKKANETIMKGLESEFHNSISEKLLQPFKTDLVTTFTQKFNSL